MKKPATPSTTSLRRAPRDEARARLVRYGITMGIRTTCFVLMVVVTPYGWWTWAFAAGAALLPYFAVVMANVGSASHTAAPVSPERQIAAAPEASVGPAREPAPGFFTISESPTLPTASEQTPPPRDADGEPGAGDRPRGEAP